jgi:hypothetical protein
MATNNFNDYCLTIANDGKAYHPVATNHFTVTMNLPKGLINQADPNKAPFNDADLTLTLKISAETFKGPGFQQSALTYKKGNLTIDYPGNISGFTSTATFDVFVTKSAYDILYSWKLASGNHITGEVGDPDDYWSDITIDVTTGNKGTLIGTWTLHNCWCSDLGSISFDNGSNNLMKCDITIHYFKPEWEGGIYEQGAAAATLEATP